jgi:hypothetical protein
MAWTTPRTWVDGELVTDTLMNTHVRDNLDYLKGRIHSIGQVSNASLLSLSSPQSWFATNIETTVTGLDASATYWVKWDVFCSVYGVPSASNRQYASRIYIGSSFHVGTLAEPLSGKYATLGGTTVREVTGVTSVDLDFHLYSYDTTYVGQYYYSGGSYTVIEQ